MRTIVAEGDATAAAGYPGRTLVIGWVPLEGSGVFGVAGYRLAGGRQLVLLGEAEGNSCGDEKFWAEIREHWKPVETYVLPQWDSMHDVLQLYRVADGAP